MVSTDTDQDNCCNPKQRRLIYMVNPQKALETFLKTYPREVQRLRNVLLNPNSNKQAFCEAVNKIQNLQQELDTLYLSTNPRNPRLNPHRRGLNSEESLTILERAYAFNISTRGI